jgi:hypothetical protein
MTTSITNTKKFEYSYDGNKQWVYYCSWRREDYLL